MSNQELHSSGIPSEKPKKKKNIYGDDALAEAPIEDHLLLRCPPTLAERLSKSIKKNQVPDFDFVFTETRKGSFHIDGETHSATLVDLPTIVETLKTIDQKQYHKIADISQMVVIDLDPKQVPKDYSWPDGITPPLVNVRKARFRKTISKKLIEDIEAQVEKLLMADCEAEDVAYEVHERKDEEMDQEEEEEEMDAMEEDEQVETKSVAEDYDFVAELEEALENASEDDFDEKDEGEEEESASEEEEEEEDEEGDITDEQRQLKQVMSEIKEELRDLESKIQEKTASAGSQINPIMRKRFEDIVTKLVKERDLKLEMLENTKKELEDTKKDEEL